MPKTNWQDPRSSEIRSTHISGLQEAVGKIEQSIGIETVTETEIPLTEVFIAADDRCRIYQAPEGKRNWTSSPAPVIKQNGVVLATNLFEIDYGGGAIVFSDSILEVDVITAEATYTLNSSSINNEISNLKSTLFSGATQSPSITRGMNKIQIPEMPVSPKIEFTGSTQAAGVYLTNPYFENRRYNLVRNGNCEEGIGYWVAADAVASLTVENSKFKLTTTGASHVKQKIPVKSYTSYYIKANTTVGTNTPNVLIYSENMVTQIASNSSSFNSGANKSVYVLLFANSAGYCYIDSIMLEEGATAPAEYKSCDLQRFVVEGQFTQDDKVTIETGKVSGLLNWKHKTLYGKDYNWQFSYDYVGYKAIYIPQANKINPPIINDMPSFGYWACVKYDGKILKNSSSGTDTFYHSDDTILNIPDADSGWTESINPSNDEVVAYMDGWKALAHDGTSRYIAWRLVGTSTPTGIADFPPGSATTLTVATTIGATSITVADSSVFKSGDILFLYGGGSLIVTGISGNVISLNVGVAAAFPVGNVVLRADNPTAGDARILTYCKNNIAPGYEGYKLHYKLANPEPITDANVQVKGEIWSLVKGDNYITVDSGVVLGEVASPTLINTTYYINRDAPIGDPNYSANNRLRNQVEQFLGQYENGAYDNSWTVDTVVPYGKVRLISVQSNYNSSAIYTVDYQILKTLHAQMFGSLSLSYPQSVISTLKGHSKALEQKQPRDSLFDQILDLGLYEEIGWDMTGRILQSSGLNGYIYYETKSMVQKRVVPDFSIKDAAATVLNGTNAAIVIPPSDFTLYVANGLHDKTRYVKLKFIYIGSNATVKQCLMDYGFIASFKVIADCRRKV